MVKTIVNQGESTTIVGPVNGTSTNNAVVRWQGTSGNTLGNSVVIVDDSGNMSGVSFLNAQSEQLNAVNNQITVQPGTNKYFLNFSNPAANRIISMPDPGTNANWVLSEGTATINGDKTFGGNLTMGGGYVTVDNFGDLSINNNAGNNVMTINCQTILNNGVRISQNSTNNQIVFGFSNTADTATLVVPSTLNLGSVSYTIPNTTPNNAVVLCDRASNTLYNTVTLAASSNQMVLQPGASRNSFTITCSNPGGNRNITLPDPGTSSASLLLTESNQTINGTKTFSATVNAPAINRTSGNLVLQTTTSGEVQLNPTGGISRVLGNMLKYDNGTGTICRYTLWNTLQTTNNTATQIISFTVLNSNAYSAHAYVFGYQSDWSANTVYFERICIGQNGNSGFVAIDTNDVTKTVSAGTGSTTACSWSVTGSDNNVTLKVTGNAGTTWGWRAFVEVMATTIS